MSNGIFGPNGGYRPGTVSNWGGPSGTNPSDVQIKDGIVQYPSDSGTYDPSAHTFDPSGYDPSGYDPSGYNPYPSGYDPSNSGSASGMWDTGRTGNPYPSGYDPSNSGSADDMPLSFTRTRLTAEPEELLKS